MTLARAVLAKAVELELDAEMTIDAALKRERVEIAEALRTMVRELADTEDPGVDGEPYTLPDMTPPRVPTIEEPTE